MKKYLIVIFMVWAAFSANKTNAQATLAEKLGFEKETKLLIVHADDAGMCNSENMATRAALESGAVSSTSLMMPCPWADDFIAWAILHPNADVGIHLTITSEWEHYRWKGILPSDKIPSLIDNYGYFHPTSAEAAKHANLKEAEKEFRAQIDRAIALGIKPTHLDSHMAIALQTPELIRLFLDLGEEYKIPNMLSRHMAKKYHLLKDPDYCNMLFMDKLIFLKGLPADSWEKEYRSLFKDLKPGLNELILHAGFDNMELQTITVNHTSTNSVCRQNDYDFVSSELFRSMINKYKIQVITWSEIQKVIYD